MTDPINTTPVQPVQPIDNGNDVGGAADVTPSYIPADVTPVVDTGTVDIDQVEVSAGVSTPTVVTPTVDVTPEETPGYIVSDTYDMNSLDKVEGSSVYDTPEDAAVQQLLAQMKTLNLIGDYLTKDELAVAINDYVTKNFVYIPDSSGDVWQTASQTISLGGGDCEDLSNLEASLMTAALMDRGYSLDEASQMVNVLVVADNNTGEGHVVVEYFSDSGVVYFDPASGTATSQIPDSMTVLFAYSSESVNVVNTDYDFTKLSTEGEFEAPSYCMLCADAANKAMSVYNTYSGSLTGLSRDFNTIYSMCNPTNGKFIFDPMNVSDTDLQALDDALTVIGSAFLSAHKPIPSAITTARAAVAKAELYGITPPPAPLSVPTDTFFQDAFNIVNAGETEAWNLNMEVVRIMNAASVLNAQAAMKAAQTKYNGDNSTNNLLAYAAAVSNYIDAAYKGGYINDSQVAALNGLPTGTQTSEYLEIANEPSNEELSVNTLGSWYSTNNTGSTITETVYPYATVLVETEQSVYIGHYEPTQYYTDPNGVQHAIPGTGGTYYAWELVWYPEGVESMPLHQVSCNSASALATKASTLDGYLSGWNLNVLYDPTNPNTSILSKDGNGYLILNKDSPTLSYLNTQIELIKGELMIISMIYEAKRDLWNLVEQELNVSAGADKTPGFKGMNINKLFTNKVKSLESKFMSVVSNILQFMDTSNGTTHQNYVDSINDKYSTIQGNTDKKDYTCDDSNQKQEDTLQNQENQLGELSSADYAYKEATAKNQAAAKAMLGKLVSPNASPDAIWGALTASVSSAVNGINGLVVDDGNGYNKIDNAGVVKMRASILGAVNLQLAFLNGEQTINDMRNLAHQELTGIGGRQSRMDIAEGMVQDEEQGILTWFDETIDLQHTKVQLDNEIQYYNTKIQDDQKQIDAIEKEKPSHVLSIILTILAVVATIASFIIPGGALLDVAIWTAIGAGFAGGIASAGSDMALAHNMQDIQAEYGPLEVIPADNYKYQAQISTVSTGDPILDMAIGAGNSVENLLAGMNGDNDLVDLGDGVAGAYSSTKAVNYMALMRSNAQLNAAELMLLIAENARENNIQTRNLVHQEMTGIGGRNPSNMTTYVMEAARGQAAFVENVAISSLQDQAQSSKMEHDRELEAHNLQAAADAADTGFGLSFIPIVGGVIGNDASSMMDLYSQKDQYQAIAGETYNAGPESSGDADIQALLDNGLIDTGNGNVGVDFNQSAQAAKNIASRFVLATMEGNIKKTMRDVRNLVNMEMTGIGGSDTDFSSTATQMNYETAMKSLELATDYLSEKAQVLNEVKNANDMVGMLQSQIDTALVADIVGFVAAVAVAIALKGSGFASLKIAAQTLQLCQEVLSAISSIGTAVNSWISSSFYSNKAKNDMGDLGTVIRMKDIMDNSVNSNQTKLEDLQQQCLDEISAELIQNLNKGYVGVNKGLAAQYKNFMENLYRGEKVRATVAGALSELRNTVHEAMTGIGGEESKAALATLGIKETAVKAQIDNLFNKLQETVDRWNQITDAQKQAAQAEAQAIKATVSAAINTAMTAISVAKALSPQNINYQAKLGELDKLKKAANDAAAIDKASDQVKLAENEYNAFAAKFSAAEISLKVASIVTPFAMSLVEFGIMENEEASAEARTSSAGITTAAKSSTVMANNAQIASAGGLTGLAANQQAEAGQKSLEYKSAAYERQSHKIDYELEHQLLAELKNTAMNEASDVAQLFIGKNENIALAKRMSAVDTDLKTIATYKNLPRDVQKSLVETLARSGITKMTVMQEVVKNAQDVLQQNPGAVLNAIQNQAKTDDFMKEEFKPGEKKASANSSSSLQRLETILKKGADIISGMESDISQIENDKTNPKEMMQKLQEQLAAAKKEVANLKSQIKLANDKLSTAQQSLAAQAKFVDEERDKIVKDMEKTEQMIKDLEKMKEQNPEKKDVIQKQVNALNKQLVGLKTGYELTKIEYNISKGAMDDMDAQSKNLEAQLDPKGKVVSDLQNAIKSLQKEISNQKKVDNTKPVSGFTNMTPFSPK